MKPGPSGPGVVTPFLSPLDASPRRVRVEARRRDGWAGVTVTENLAMHVLELKKFAAVVMLRDRLERPLHIVWPRVG